MRNCGPLIAVASVLAFGVSNAQQPAAPSRTTGTEPTLRIGTVATAPARTTLQYGQGLDRVFRAPQRKADARLQGLGPGDSVFSTVYDFQSNASMADKIINWPGEQGLGGVLATLVYMGAPNASADRGSYGAILFDAGGGPTWTPIDLGTSYNRLEGAVRSGFNEVDHFADGRVVNVSHNGSAADPSVNVMIENEPASGAFAVSTIPGSANGLWPRMAVGGDDVIHVIWAESGLDLLWYARSTDRGLTWSAPVQLAGTDENGQPTSISIPNREGEDGFAPGGNSADTYQMDAAGNQVAIWYQTGGVGLYQLRSSDNGATWLRSGYIAQPEQVRSYRGDASCDTCFYPDPDNTNADTIAFRSDTAAAPGSGFDLLVGEDGTIYGVYPILPTYVIRRYTNNMADSAGIIYQADFSYTNIGMRSVWVNANDQYAATGTITQPGNQNNQAQFLDGRSYVGGFSRWAQLGKDASNNVYMVFGSGESSDVVTGTPAGGVEGTFMFSHLYATWTRDGQVWSNPMNLTPNGVDAQWGSLGDLVDNQMAIAYQADTYPGDYLTSSGSGGSTLHPNVPSVVEAYMLNTSTLPEPVSGVRETATAPAYGEITSAMPNPTSGLTRIAYKVDRTSDVSIRVVNALGEQVMTLVDGMDRVPGMYTVSFNASALPAGSYRIVMSLDGSVATSALNVVR